MRQDKFFEPILAIETSVFEIRSAMTGWWVIWTVSYVHSMNWTELPHCHTTSNSVILAIPTRQTRLVTMNCKHLGLVVALALVDYAESSCPTDYEHSYVNSDNFNWGPDNLKPDWESCRSSCASNYPTATHFDYKSHSKFCWCKTSDSGRRYNANAISGKICRGKRTYLALTMRQPIQKSYHTRCMQW